MKAEVEEGTETGTGTAVLIMGPKNILSQPNSNYVKSKEGIEEYKKVGLNYPDNFYDEAYSEFLQATPEGKGNDHCQKNKTKIISISRVRLGPNKECLTWHQTDYRWTPLGNKLHKTRCNLGIYPVIEVENQMQIDAKTGYRHVITVATGVTKTGYSKSYTIENVDELHKYASDKIEFDDEINGPSKPTQYYVRDFMNNNIPVSIPKWEDFRTGDFDELYQYGKKVTSRKEAKAFKDNIDIQRQKAEKQSVIDMLENRKKMLEQSNAVGAELERQWQNKKTDAESKKKEYWDSQDKSNI